MISTDTPQSAGRLLQSQSQEFTAIQRPPTMQMPRRKFLAGLLGLVAAPAVVKIASLMPVRAFEPARSGMQFATIVRAELQMPNAWVEMQPPAPTPYRYIDSILPSGARLRTFRFYAPREMLKWDDVEAVFGDVGRAA